MKKLLAMLQSNPSADLSSLAATAASGNLEEAKKKISNLLSSPEAQELLKQLEKQL